ARVFHNLPASRTTSLRAPTIWSFSRSTFRPTTARSTSRFRRTPRSDERRGAVPRRELRPLRGQRSGRIGGRKRGGRLMGAGDVPESALGAWLHKRGGAIFAFIALFVAWEFAVRVTGIKEYLLPPPS